MIRNGDTQERLSGLRKSAILMIILGDQVSAEILRHLDEDEVQSIGREVARVSAISADEAEGILDEFYQMAVAHEYVLKGGLDYAKKILVNAFGPEAAKRMLDRLMKTLG
ncbi:MAG: magnesium and cobalt transport protein CorA, partial [Bryobacteraceae bacterium]